MREMLSFFNDNIMEVSLVALILLLIGLVVYLLEIASGKRKRLFGGAAIITVLYLLVVLAKYSFVEAIVISIGIVLFVMLSSILLVVRDSGKDKSVQALPIHQDTLYTIERVLKFGAATLAIISCYTTANGMKDVVFGGWIAFPASVAVQTTLAVFSFWMLRFMTNVNTLNWPRSIERVACCAIILAWCGYILLSSFFSYAFIATNAYADMKNSNSEAISRTYFTNTVNNFIQENERRGRLLYDELSVLVTSEHGLSNAVQAQNKTANQQYANDILLKLNSIQSMSTDNSSNIEEEADFDDIDSRLNNLSEGSSSYINLSSIKNALVNVNNSMKGYAGQIDTCITKIQQVTKIKPEDFSSNDYQTILDCYNSLYGNTGKDMENSLDSTENIINGISTNYSVIVSHKATARQNVQDLKRCIQGMQNGLNDAVNIIKTNGLANKTGTVTGNGVTLTSAEDLLKRINMIQNAAEGNVDPSTAEKDLDALIQETSTWTASQGLDVNVLENVNIFCKDLKEYKKYINLKHQLANFQENNVALIYVVTPNKDEEKKVGSIVYLSEENWKAERNDDFYMLESYISQFPKDPDEQSTIDVNAEAGKAIQLQRKLLSELTDIEQAISYFDNEYAGYRKMAVFSALIAVFFDLGGFVMGCWMFLLEYFKKDGKTESDTDMGVGAQTDMQDLVMENGTNHSDEIDMQEVFEEC